MSNKVFNIGLIGAGCIAHTHAETFKILPDVNIVAVAEILKERRENFAKQYGIATVVDDYKKLLEMDEIDAVVLCLPNYLHAPVAIAAMRAGKHVLTEKPMAIDKENAEQMVKVQIGRAHV